MSEKREDEPLQELRCESTILSPQPKFRECHNCACRTCTRRRQIEYWSAKNRSSAVHKVLNIVEILDMILSFLNPNLLDPEFDHEEREERLRTLARVARTCQSLKDPALAMLWKEQDGLGVIFDLFNNVRPSWTQDEISLSFITCYTTRIRRLRFCGVISDTNMSKLALLCKINKQTPLFPYLRHLQLESWPLTPNEASLLFGSDLEVIDLGGPYRMSDSQLTIRTGQLGKLSRQQHVQLCAHKLLKSSPKLRRLRSLTLLEFESLRCLASEFDLTKTPTHPKAQDSPIWLQKLRRIQYLSDLHFDACRLGMETTPESQSVQYLVLSVTYTMLTPISNDQPFSMLSPSRDFDLASRCYAGIFVGDICIQIHDPRSVMPQPLCLLHPYIIFRRGLIKD
ncbi:hypothetical protein QCA50_010699 [Cerrena zonata]|uniref:F-box domain-containing protein n=1 Tax=Cerrena zonata TaxID=2478898 RepID=A0AAW0G305_9APHY